MLKARGTLPVAIPIFRPVMLTVTMDTNKPIAFRVVLALREAIQYVHNVPLVNILPVEQNVQIVVLTPTLLLEHLPVQPIQAVVLGV